MQIIDIINRMFKSEDKKWTMIYLSALTYGLSLDTLSNTLNMDKKDVSNKLSNIKISAQILANKPYVIMQDSAESMFLDYWQSLYNAVKEKNHDLQRTIIEKINDKNVKDFQENHKSRAYSTTDEDIIALIKYQIKYKLSTEYMCKYFHLARKNYVSRIKGLDDEYKTLKSDWQALNDFFDEQFKTNYHYNKQTEMRM